MIALDGITYARRTGKVESSGENISKSPLFTRVTEHPDSFYFAKDAIRGIPTWFSYRKMQEYPIIATVGSSEQDILADYANRQPRYITPRIIISVLLILFSFLLAIILLHRIKLSERLLKEEKRYQRLLGEQMIAVQEREREYVGRELHDNVSQVLTTVKLYLEIASKEGDSPLIPRSIELINNSIHEIRNLSHQLSAPTLGTRSLLDAIYALIEMIDASTDIAFNFDHEGYQDRINMSQKLALYRILQEQLNNIIKHADATVVWVSLHENDDNVILSVIDNGKGFDSKVRGAGMGINNIISRVNILGGTAVFETALGKGCSLTVMIPAVTTGEDVTHPNTSFEGHLAT